MKTLTQLKSLSLCLVVGLLSFGALGQIFDVSFDYSNRGEDWAETVKGAELCKIGREQSPIALDYKNVSYSDKMELNGYGYTDFKASKTDIQLPLFKVQLDEGEFILNLYDGKKQLFKPIQFELHLPSEHTIDKRTFDAEVQVLHQYKGTDGQLGAVIAIFFDTKHTGTEGQSSDFVESILDILENNNSDTIGTIGLQDFLQSVDFSSYWNYDGSLTTPPCQEDIKWTVLNDI